MVEFQVEVRKGLMLIRISSSSAEDLLQSFETALDVLKKMEQKLLDSEIRIQSEKTELKELEGIPSLENPESIRDAVSQLMSSDWGKTPRTIGELMDAMETNAIYYPKSSVSSCLSRMTRSGLLRRIKSPQGYRYISGVKKTTK